MPDVATVFRIAGMIFLATPVWYIPARRSMEYIWASRTPSGRIKRVTLVEWLNATGVGLFAAILLLSLGNYLQNSR